MNFLGHTRFSLLEPKSPSWRLSREVGRSDLDAYSEILFSEDRLANRAEIFINHTLPIIDVASKSHHIVHVVSYPVELPIKYKEKLALAAERFRWLHLDERSAPKNNGRFLDRLANEIFPPGTVYGEYRLDDDDILSSRFFHKLSPYISENYVGTIVSLGIGVQSFFDEGRFLKPRLEHRPKIAIGLTRVCKTTGDGVAGPPRVAHTKSDRVCPVILDSTDLTFLHTLHLTQDSGIRKPDGDLARRVRNYLRLPAVPEQYDLQQLFPGIRFDESTSLPSESFPATLTARIVMGVESVMSDNSELSQVSRLRHKLRNLFL